MTIEIAETAEDLSIAGAREFVRITASAVQSRGRCVVALAGGSTPRGMYSMLARTMELRTQVPWHRVEFFWGDERFVPPDHAESNYKMAFETLLSLVPVQPEQIHRVRTESGDADRAAREYETDIRATVRDERRVPRFDLMLLGLGRDGHTASLFPGTSALAERQRLCVANWVDSLGAYRITMTLPVLNAAHTVLFLVSGADKASIVRDVLQPLQPRETSQILPAQLVQPSEGELVWMLDRQAASELGDGVP